MSNLIQLRADLQAAQIEFYQSEKDLCQSSEWIAFHQATLNVASLERQVYEQSELEANQQHNLNMAEFGYELLTE